MRNSLLSMSIALLSAILVSGCAAVSAVDTSDKSAIQAALKVGDRISVTTTEYQHHSLTIADLSDVGISATTANDTLLTISYEDLSSLQIIEPKPVRTALGVTGAFAFSAAVAVEYPAYFLASVLLFWD